jgi:hypothetical protein
VRAQAASDQPNTEWSTPQTFNIQPSQLKIDPLYFIGTTADKAALTAQTYTLGVDVKNSENQLTDAVLTISISEPDGTPLTVSTITHVSAGKYSFPLVLTQTGSNLISVRAEALGTSKTITETFSVTSGGTAGGKTCTEDPTQAKCQPVPYDYTTIILIAVVVIGVGIIIYKLTKKGKK